MNNKTKIEKDQDIKYNNIIIKFSDYSFEDFIETLVEMYTHKLSIPLSEVGTQKATQEVLKTSNITKENIFENFQKLLQKEKVNDFLRYQKFFNIQDTEIRENLKQEIIQTFVSLVKKEDLIHAFDINHLISEQDFNNILNSDLKETIEKKIEKYIQTGEINFFNKIIKLFKLNESDYINDENKKLAIKGIQCCLEDKNLDKIKQIKEKFKIQDKDLFEKTEMQEKIIKILSEYLEDVDYKEFKKTCDTLNIPKQDIINNSNLRKSALHFIDKALKTTYTSNQAVLIKEFFNFSTKDLNENLDTYILDPNIKK